MIYVDKNQKLEQYFKNISSKRRLGKYFSCENSQTILETNENIKNFLMECTPEILPKNEIPVKVSVIMLLYNCVNFRWLEQAILSILWQQAFGSWDIQIFFVVDPPWGDTGQYLQEIIYKYSKFAKFGWVMNGEKIGYAGSYNMALDHCDGDLIFIQDYDDISHPERFIWSKRIIDANPYLKCVAFTPIVFDNDDPYFESKTVSSGSPAILNNATATMLEVTFLRKQIGIPFNRINPQTICMTNEIAKSVRIDNKYVKLDSEISQMDRIFILHLLQKYPFSLLQSDKCLVWCRRHSNQTCKNKFKKSNNFQFEITQHIECSNKIISALDNMQLKQLADLKKSILNQAGIVDESAGIL